MNHYLLTHNKKRQYALIIGDVLCILVSIVLSYLIKDIFNQEPHPILMMRQRLHPAIALIPMLQVFALYMLDQYNLYRLINPVRSSIMVICSVFLAGVFISGILFFFPRYIFGRQVFLIHMVLGSILMVLWRLFLAHVLVRKAKPKRLALVGDGQILSSFIEELTHIPNNVFKVKSVCLTNGISGNKCPFPVNPNNYRNVFDLVRTNDFDALAFDSTSGVFTDAEIKQILEIKYRGKALYDLSELYEKMTGKVPLTYIDGRWLLNRDSLQGEVHRTYVRSKRIIDMVFSSVLLLLAAPLFALITAAIKIDSRGRIFFIQERLGLYRKPFRCIKFRTMIEDAERESGPIWSEENDPRITHVGRFCRKSRLDELPQLWNILKGDMSFVGPRPIREHFADMLEQKIPFYGLRFNVKPGLTGWAQVQHDYAGSEEGQMVKFQYELFYIKNMSFFIDLLTIFHTTRIVLRGRGI